MSLPASHSPSLIWESALAHLVLKVTRQNFDNWLRNTVGMRFEGTTMVVATPTDLVADWLSTRLKSVVRQALTDAAGPGLNVRFEAVREHTPPPASFAAEPLQRELLSQQPTPPNPRFTFASFLAGEHNKVAVTAVLDVARTPDSPYSPLFIAGPPGCGKTHLLHSMAHEAAGLGARFLLVNADQFTSDFTTSVRARTGAAFRSRYREVDLLLVDDVHQLVGKKATQAEFYHTVAALHDHGRRIALAGDHHALMQEASSRFDGSLRWGLVATIGQPDASDRIRFVQSRTACQGLTLPVEVIHYIALRVRSNMRELEGAVNRVLAHARITEGPLTIDVAARALQPLSAAPLRDHRPVQPATVLRAACDHLSISEAELRSQRRTRTATYARHLAMYLLRNDAGLVYTAVAQLLDRKDHSTVVHACSQVEKEMKLSPAIRADIDAIRLRMQALSTAA